MFVLATKQVGFSSLFSFFNPLFVILGSFFHRDMFNFLGFVEYREIWNLEFVIFEKETFFFVFSFTLIANQGKVLFFFFP